MKTLVEKWTYSPEISFSIKEYTFGSKEALSDEVLMRMHDEYEITLLLGCRGKRFVGNTIENFSGSDLFFIGPHVPHAIQLDKGQVGRGITIHFLRDAFGNGFFDIPESKDIDKLLQNSKLGIAYLSTQAICFYESINALIELKSFDRMIAFFQLLQKIATVGDGRVLSSRGFTPLVNQKDYEIVNKTYKYIMNRFENQPITLNEISSHVNMSPATFCRYFKKHFHKTFTNFLNEVRVGHACKLLQETNKNIAEIGFASGYNQLSHFNRQFKEIVGYSPKEYRLALNG
ncbi:MAG: AraC family transcriptional regulator [Bacteroidota bacterium]